MKFSYKWNFENPSVNSLSPNSTKWPNTIKQFVVLALKGLIGHSLNNFPRRITQSSLSLKKWRNRFDRLTIGLTFVKSTSMINTIKSLIYFKCYSSSRTRPIKSPSKSIRYDWQKIYCSTSTSENITGNQKTGHTS